MNQNETVVTKQSSWANRITISIPAAQMARLRRNKGAQLMRCGRWYELRPSKKMVIKIGGKRVTVENGKLARIMKILG